MVLSNWYELLKRLKEKRRFLRPPPIIAVLSGFRERATRWRAGHHTRRIPFQTGGSLAELTPCVAEESVLWVSKFQNLLRIIWWPELSERGQKRWQPPRPEETVPYRAFHFEEGGLCVKLRSFSRQEAPCAMLKG